MNDEATLRDATVDTDPAAGTDTAAATTTETKPETTVQVTADQDAQELGQILLQSGYTKAQINDLLETPNALQSIQFMIRNNPAEFLNMLERTDPNAAKAFHEKMADIYVERYSDKSNGRAAGGSKEVDPSLMQEIAALREKVTQSETREQQRENAAMLARLESQYRGRVDELFNKVKEITPLTRSEEKALRARLDAELAVDVVAKKRISSGNFVDVPTKLKTITDEWTADKKAATEGEKTRRERNSRNAFPELQSGPGPIDIPKGFEDSWDSTEDAFARALEQTS